MYGKEREPICFVCASIFDKKLLERGRHSFVPPVKFKCAGRDCEKELTFRQLVDGQCCPETAFVLSLESSAHVNTLFQCLKNQADKCKKDVHRARSTFGRTKKVLEEAIQAHEKSTQKFEKAEAAFKTKQQQEKELFSLISNRNRAIKLSAASENEQKPGCQVCMENYNNDERFECALPCGHRSCMKCLTHLSITCRSLCPTCQQPFSKDQIIKLY
ncbi:Oidioi.mRNA.OKI2018_I69.XSR.g14982.t1.cds [Oikopleura dioica]|uniref:Oidioi.mRNA.OKI2018_I69.XSR.g14982.t1.cds n=1 Tax=Oikopleura dioica TaxID=34765 RepID=A0ABN7SD54_OIKDI|nr:Oidioi.mRNA.OKI2018_I69.XSR.g14982.t1.cds [Oikopleura dioica]